MDDSETIEHAVNSKCKCGGVLKVVKSKETRIIKIVCDSCGLQKS